MPAPVLPIPPLSPGRVEVAGTDDGQHRPRKAARRPRPDVSLEVKTAGSVALALGAAFAALVIAPGGTAAWALALVLTAAGALVVAVLDLWVYRPVRALVRRSRQRLGAGFARSDPDYRDELRELAYLVNALIAVFTAAEDKEWVARSVQQDLLRVHQAKRQLLDVGEMGAEINAALPYKETVERALSRIKAFLRADLVVLLGTDASARMFTVEGANGLDLGELSSDCCAYTPGCPVRRAAENGQIVRATDHSCGLVPATLAAQLAVPFTIPKVGDFALLAAATAWDHFSEVGDDVLSALQGHLQSALANAHRYDAIRRQVVTDHLTRLYNRRYFMNRAREEVERSLRYQQPLSVLMADIDHFKSFNDRYGHATGDRVLQAVAGILKGAFRGVDICARLGGEEFAILLPNTTGEDACNVASRVRHILKETRYTGLGLPFEVNITISIGVATCPRDATTVTDLLELADRALYAAKAHGRDQVQQHGGGARQRLRG